MAGHGTGGRWELAVRAPAEPLRGCVVGDYVGYSEWSHGPSRRRELPGPFVVVAIEFGPPLRVLPAGDARLGVAHRGGFVGGLDERHAICEHDGFQQGIQVTLAPIGARLLFGVPMSELARRVVPLRDVLPRRHRDLAARLQDLPDWDARFDLLDSVILDAVRCARVETSVVAWAVRRIEETGGSIEMRALARELGYSPKHVIALFRDQVGIPPKLLARITRFDRLMRHLRRGTGGPWADLALQFGYYDQAHLVREVREFAGVTPTEVRSDAAESPALLA